MTAAALQPRLFDHLFASRPEPASRSSLTATALSILLHASIVTALMWASVHFRPAIMRPIENVTPVMIAVPMAQAAEPAQGAQGGAAASSRIVTPSFNVPDVIPNTIPRASDAPAFVLPSTGDQPGSGQPASTPRDGSGGEVRDGFAVLSVMPALLNAEAVRRALERNYPPLLRDAEIGGRAMIWALLDENGRVIKAEIRESSGHPALDDVALKIAPLMQFSPGKNRDQAVKVWVSVPIVFRTH